MHRPVIRRTATVLHSGAGTMRPLSPWCLARSCWASHQASTASPRPTPRLLAGARRAFGRSDAWNTLTVDMIVKRQRLTSAGDAIGAPTPNATYRLERSSRSGSWKTVVTVLSVARPPIYSFSGAITSPQPFPVARIEDDEDGSPVRAYGANGALLTPTLLANTTASTTSARTTGQQWLDTFVAAPGKKTARQQAFERAYGKAAKAGTLSKYVRLQTEGSDEVLVDPKTVVPVEANTIRAGKRLGHRTFLYGAAPDSALVRTNIHAERSPRPTLAIAPSSTRRSRTSVSS